MLPIKCVFVGNKNTGKTTLICKYAKHKPPPKNSTIVSNYCVVKQIRESKIMLNIWDIGSSLNINLRKLAYPQTNVFIICFDVYKDRLSNIIEWYDEIKIYKTKTLILGMKNDLVLEEDVSKLEGFANKIDAQLLFCSSEKDYNIGKTFKKIADAAMNEPIPKSTKIFCCF